MPRNELSTKTKQMDIEIIRPTYDRLPGYVPTIILRDSSGIANEMIAKKGTNIPIIAINQPSNLVHDASEINISFLLGLHLNHIVQGLPFIILSYIVYCP